MHRNNLSVRFYSHGMKARNNAIYYAVSCSVWAINQEEANTRAYEILCLLDMPSIEMVTLKIYNRGSDRNRRNYECCIRYYLGRDRKEEADQLCLYLNRQMIALEIEELQEQLATLDK